MSSRPHLLLGVFLLSLALLALEILFVRLISILFYPVAAYLVVSLALLGYGVSGAALSVRRAPGAPSLSRAAWGAAGFSLTALAALACVWYAPRSIALAASLPIALGLPFAFGGLAIAIALNRPEAAVSRVYFADLVGAGAGVGVVLLGLRWLSGPQVLALVAAAGMVAAAVLAGLRRARLAAGAGAAILGLGGIFIPFPKGITPIAPKELALFTALGPQVRWEYQGWNPLARVDVLSLPGERIALPEAIDYKLVTQDGGAPTLLLALPQPENADFAEHTILGVPYWLKTHPKVFIVGLGGGPDVQAALHYDAREITGVEINPQMIELVRGPFADFTGRPYADPRVTIIQGDGRHAIRRSAEEFDIIQLTGVDTTVASPGANPNLAENYLYTVEAFREYLQHLAPGGLLSISFPDVAGLSLRLEGTAWLALTAEGAPDPEAQIVVSRTGGFAHLLVKEGPFTAAEIATLRERFAGPLVGVYFPLFHRLFGHPDQAVFEANEILYAPGLAAPDGAHSALLEALAAGQAEPWMAAQASDVRPTTDDRPFFFVLDKWGGYAPNFSTLTLVLTLLAAASLIFLLLPPLVLNRRGLTLPGTPLLAVYFVALGVGYIAIEVNLIQRLSLFLGHPSYALAAALGGLLVASGLGSYFSGRTGLPPRRWVVAAGGGTAALALLYVALLTPLFDALLGLPLVARVIIGVALIALPGFLMGVPFPSGLAVVKRRAPAFVPWAWALNSSGTVMGTIAALLAAMQWGFSAVFVAAAGLYLLAAGAFALFAREAA